MQRILILAPFWLWSIVMATPSPSQEWVRVPIARDTWLSNYQKESAGSNGGAPRLKLKSILELSILDFDASVLEGREILDAQLHLRVAGEEPIERVTVSTLTSEWVEGTGNNYEVLQGVSTFSHQDYPKQRWRNSDLTAVCIGQGGSFYASVDPKPGEREGWIALDIPEKILRARAAGMSFGIVLMDDTGSTWTRRGEEFEYHLFPNRYVFSRDSNTASAPYLRIQLAERSYQVGDPASLSPPHSLRYEPADDTFPQRRLRWKMEPADQKDLLGFRVRIGGARLAPMELPAWSQHRDGEYVLPLESFLQAHGEPGRAALEIQAVDRLGRATPAVRFDVPIEAPSPPRASLSAIEAESRPLEERVDWSNALKGLGTRWAVLDPLDLWVPGSGRWVPAQPRDHLLRNHLWDATTRTISLEAARGAWVGFQIACETPADAMDLRIEWDERGGETEEVRTELYRYARVKKGDEWIPDPLVQLATGTWQCEATISEPSQPSVAGAPPSHSWLIETYLPPELPAGIYEGKCVLSRDGQELPFTLRLRLHDVVLPKTLSFLPEMNCYNLPANDRDYYRLGHRHRVVVNRLPYFQNGKLAEGCCPVWRDGQFDWTPFDERYAEILDGRAFADLPRGPLAIECFYLPLHENWPSPMEGNYNGSYWADRAFPGSYRVAWESAVAQYAEHLSQKEWLQTRFHIYLNNKVDFKKRGWSRGSSPWLLDEPSNFQDFWAVRYFAVATREGLRQARVESGRAAQVLFRGDISRPQWQRDTLDGLMDYAVLSKDSFGEYRSLVLDRKFRDQQTLVLYGSNNPVGTNNATAVAWSWDAWCRGTDGVLPWQTIGRPESWEQADELALFYPDPAGPSRPPSPSIRLKAYCYGEQDIELLTQLAQASGGNRYEFGEWMGQQIQLRSTSRVEGQYSEPATWSDYANLSTGRIHQWRRAWLAQLAAARGGARD